MLLKHFFFRSQAHFMANTDLHYLACFCERGNWCFLDAYVLTVYLIMIIIIIMAIIKCYFSREHIALSLKTKQKTKKPV